MSQNTSPPVTSVRSTEFHPAEQERKDVSKVFAELRAKLNAKEKELLELQRASPCLLAPDNVQSTALLESIGSLHLSTEVGSFLFAPLPTDRSSSLIVPSTGVESIKTLPSSVWLAERKSMKDEPKAGRLPMVAHLLSLPVSAYLSSKAPDSSVTPLPVSLDAFKPPSVKKETPKSLLDGQSVYSKEFWLRKPEVPSSSSAVDLDKYIEQSSEKMRRLHTEYLAALELLKSPAETTTTTNSTEAIRCLYPQVFDRMQQQKAQTTNSARTRPAFPSN